MVSMGSIVYALPSPISFSNAESLNLVHRNRADTSWIPAHGLQISISTNESYPGISLPFGTSFSQGDWKDVGGIAFEIENPEHEEVSINVRIDDDKSRGSSQGRTGVTKLLPLTSATIVFPMPSAFPGMVLPPSELANNNGKMWSFFGPHPDESNIRSLSLFVIKPEKPIRLFVKNITWLPRPRMDEWIDVYGQNTRTNWPGKIHSNQEFREQIKGEDLWIKAHPPNPDWDQYRGWKAGPSLAKGDWFRTVLIANGKELPSASPGAKLPAGARWWLVTPSGHLFFSLGMDCVTFGEDNTILGRESWFQPINGNGVNPARVNFLKLNLERKYGGEWKSAFINRSLARLGAWNFNTLGNWCAEEFYERHRMPYTKCIGYKHPPKIISSCALPDFFHPEFPKLVAEGLAHGVASSRNDSWCIGYFVDNELSWDTWENSGLTNKGTLARAALEAPPGTPAREALIKELQDHYTTLEAFNKAWGTRMKSWQEQFHLPESKLTPIALVDSAHFMHSMAMRYYSVVSLTLKKLDPNHLYLGSRLNQRPMEVVRTAARYCDVVSFNVYADDLPKEDWAFYQKLGKPAIVGEFHFSAPDRGMFPGPKFRRSQSEKAKAYAHYVMSVANNPCFVGCHWFQYVDEPIAGRWFDGENFPIGFLSVTDHPYEEMAKTARDFNAAIYTTRSKQ
jgi:hypothetical protein